ncbi:hypothetical protein KP509_39G052100 [Ceratopteris richardii]|uniref:Lachrymatory factor synthase n=1 Tax=Ceratopteris richardii TaxID=49495 RepID=A0A8T2Q1E5_CERRI|nr:hypothetical protein KP509_39G052100 [Ceratopteris richardii]KAH7277446.1 hypothetical protein KP509_39G052100 [Ceratopteris richardii]
MKRQEAVEIYCMDQDHCRFTLERKQKKSRENCSSIQDGLTHQMEDEIWEGIATREIEAPEGTIWELLSDFGQIQTWHTSAEICEIVEGENNKPGCVRYCAGGGRAIDGSPARWVKEKLLTLDFAGRHMTYCILDSSYGFQDYRASLSVMPGLQDVMPCVADEPNALVYWKFEMKSLPGVAPQELLRFIASIFAGMMYNLERAVWRSEETSAPLAKAVASCM